MTLSFYWAELWLVNNIFYAVWGPNPAAERNVDTSRFWIIFENFQNRRQIIGTPHRSIFHARQILQNAIYGKKKKKIDNCNNKIKYPLELRLVFITDRSPLL